MSPGESGCSHIEKGRNFGQEGSFSDKRKCPGQVVRGQRGRRRRRGSIQLFHNENDVNESSFDIDSLSIPEVESSNTGRVGDDLNSDPEGELVLRASESF